MSVTRIILELDPSDATSREAFQRAVKHAIADAKADDVFPRLFKTRGEAIVEVTAADLAQLVTLALCKAAGRKEEER